ncbi:MAG: YegP family protein [Bacteroidetes bacterium]|nr:YegP family protein [Bacteroidota bacterium]
MKTATFKIIRGKDDLYYFNLFPNGNKSILNSQGYNSLSNCYKGIKSVQKNGVDKERYRMLNDENGQHYFDLIALNNRIIGTSNFYSSKRMAERSLQSVRNSVSYASIKEDLGVATPIVIEEVKEENPIEFYGTPFTIPEQEDIVDNPIEIPEQEETFSETIKEEDPLKKLMHLKRPDSTTTIQMNEVFTVPLDEFYSALYQEGLLDLPVESNKLINTEMVPIQAKTEVEILDIRPKRWYRQYKVLKEYQDYASTDRTRAKMRLSAASTAVDKFDGNGNFNALENELVKRRTEYHTISDQQNLLRDKMEMLLREMRINGYTIKKETGIKAIKDLGYDFHIVKTMAKKSKIDLPSGGDIYLKDDKEGNKNWGKLEKILFEELIKKGSLPPYIQQEFKYKQELISSFDKCTILYEQIEELRLLIDQETKETQNINIIIQELENKRKFWITDLKYLEQSYNNIINTNKEQTDYFTMVFKWMMGCRTLNAETVFVNYGRRRGKFKQTTFTNKLEELEFEVKVYEREGVKYLFVKIQGSSNTVIMTLFNKTGAIRLPKNQGDFFQYAIKSCRDFVYTELPRMIKEEHEKLNELETKSAVYQLKIKEIEENGIAKERLKFLEYWKKMGDDSYTTKVIYPHNDPLGDFLVSSNGEEEESSTTAYIFRPTADGFFNQFGQSLSDFMKNPEPDKVLVLPVIDKEGNVSEEVLQVVKNPSPSRKSAELPVIKFVETYVTNIGWKGYCLGELSHSFNLFPGETKELTIEKHTKITKKLSSSTNNQKSTDEEISSSFEDNLQNEFSDTDKSSRSDSFSENNDRDESDSTEIDDSIDTDVNETVNTVKKFDWNVKAKVSANWGLGKASISGGSGGSTNTNSTTTDNTKTHWNKSTDHALKTSRKTEGKRMSDQSKDIFKKNVQNAIKKVANKTSVNNKLEVTSSSSEEYTEDVSNKELIKIENPNIGRTVNYNFFQIQNTYGVTTNLTDVKIVINTGVELIEGTGINDIRVYELEEFGKIYANSDHDVRDAILAAIICKQVMKNYGKNIPGNAKGNGALSIAKNYNFNKEKLADLNFSGDYLSKSVQRKDVNLSEVIKGFIKEVLGALDELKKIPFVFNETILSEESLVNVNAGAYHMEAQVGLLPATEDYLEERREIETNFKKAELSHLEAKTKSGTFNELPDSITHLNYDAHHANSNNGTNILKDE